MDNQFAFTRHPFVHLLMTILICAGMLTTMSACGKRGDPVRPSEVAESQ